MFEEQAAEFVRDMEARGVPHTIASKAAEAGYVVWPIENGWGNTPRSMVMDCHYGLKMSGLFELDEFAAFLNGAQTPAQPPIDTPTYKNVRDLKDLREIAESPRHREAIEQGFTSFRGQPRDYWMSRSVPNPRICDAQRMERIITPSYWRQFLDQPLSARNLGPSQSIFETFQADELVYHGIADWRTLHKRNHERYGPHFSISDLEDFHDPESQEYFKRWKRHRFHDCYEYPLIEQHYGKKTIGLDITFDLATAAFFASHRWSELSNSLKATYRHINEGEHEGVIYFFRFRDPAVRQTDYLVNKLGVFEHLPVERPIRQRCGLPAFRANEIAAAARDLDAVILLDANFDTDGLPEPNHLFPLSEDPFYLALLEQKKRFGTPWNWVVDYEF
ncbi:hypothetical protein [Limnohabitans sp. T6-5]|uniref:hypothetical protein n=1 Tax=Limnohabitans sp. T6-5 TaxID=1100724 RepID=UPI0011B223ED|nr:hypothetical protein [Limnohabitans sp. T6-5]